MKKKVNPVLLRQVLRSAAVQITNKFVYAQASSEKAAKVREALLVPASENVLYIFGNATFLTATM